MAKWTEENDILQACAQLIQVRSNATYPQCEEMLATGPRPPPYIAEKLYKPGVGAHRIAVRALSLVRETQDLRSFDKAPINPSESFLGSGRLTRRNKLHPHGVMVMFFCAVCALATVPGLLLLAGKRRRGKRAPVIPATAQDPAGAFRTFRVNLRSTFIDGRAATTQHQPRRERMLKDIRLRLRRRRANTVTHASPRYMNRGSAQQLSPQAATSRSA
ncbi:MAG: hypothetical protein Q9166_007241 [cf. Caloplaca sp. 2 TL-2023]